jgi:DNA-binding response OmpR family regulator
MVAAMKKILVIEDEQFIRENIVEILQSHDYDVLSAPDGVAGVELALKHLPDLILCDVMMPDLDGHGVLEQLRDNDATSATPFIFLTARANTQDLRVGMNLGADDYLTKPFRVPDLLKAVDTRLTKSDTEKRQSDTRLNELRESISLSLPHEFLTPISGILGCSDLILSSYDLMSKDEILELLTQLNLSARRLSRLIQNFLLHARLITMSVDNSPEQIREKLRGIEFTESARAVVNDVVNTKSVQDHRKDDVQMNLEADADVAMRQMYFSKIVEEVIDNAFRYSHPGMPITVSTHVDTKKRFYVCSIHNTGRHITAEQIASIGAYTQFDRKIYEQQGSGLGLSIVKKLLEYHDGALQIVSDEGETTVSMLVPLHEKNKKRR